MDNINPDHYKSQTSLECIESMEIIFGPAAVVDFCMCNAWKYIWRWRNKNGLEDLRKAEWYVDHAYDMLYSGDLCDERIKLLDGIKNYILKKTSELEVKENE